MRISDWSSDVCSSDLVEGKRTKAAVQPDAGERIGATLLALCLPGDCVAAFESRRYVECAQRLAKRHGVTPAMLEPGRRLRIIGDEEGGRDPAGNAVEQAKPGFGKTRSEEHTSELQSLMRISYAVLCLEQK